MKKESTSRKDTTISNDILDPKTVLNNEQDHQKAQDILNAGNQPSKILRFLMTRFEHYRQSKKIGWSRVWNKKHVINFQSFKLNDKDLELRQLALQVIAAECPKIPDQANQFVQELLSGDVAPMGFVFIHELNENGQIYEGAVLSYGRANSENRRYRDRLDIILESPITNGNSQGFSRLRIYIDPYLGHKQALWSDVKQEPFKPITEQLFNHLSALSWDWAADKNRLWEHWVTQYIEFFGPRKTPVESSYFHTANPNCRISDQSSGDKAA
ncbi:MAG: hypothetical protein V3V18_07110 [Methylococcales bacterium]